MTKRIQLLIIALAVVAMLLLMAACRGDSNANREDPAKPPAPVSGSEGASGTDDFKDGNGNGAGSENSKDGFGFEDLADMVFTFSSGVGAWSTELQIQPDGSFVGKYHDTDMGDTGEGYPGGTVYFCSFSGRFSSLEKTGEYEYSMICESITQEGTPGDEEIKDGVRYITSTPYGFEDANEFLLYLPGRKTADLPENFLWWVGAPRGIVFENVDTLEFYGLYNVAGEMGFSY